MLATPAFAQDCGSATNLNLVENPPTFGWVPGGSFDNQYETGTLVMDKVALTINGESLVTRAYAQEGQPLLIPGPTLEMEAGKQYVMKFHNLLPYEPRTHEHNTFTDPNVTNVHTHGLHISGESPGDDVTRFFEGRHGGDYVYDIPADHMSGTFWYHAHHHGSTFLQVSSGAFGLIIIRNPAQDEFVPQNVKDMDERHLILGFLEPGNAKGTGGDTLIDGTFSAGWTINGTVNGDVCMPPNTWQNWRMLVADQDARLVDLEIGDGCEVALMARDGVWRTEVPKALGDNSLTLTGASRADLAVRCSSNSTITVGGVQVANVVIDDIAQENTGPGPYAASESTAPWSIDRPPYLRDLRNETVDNSESIRNLTQGLTGVQEYSLNGATNHPFHLHIYHVQVQSDCGPFEAGEYYDVIAGNCDLRFDLSEPAGAYKGRTIFHCHILQHEDQGAMGWLQVTDGKPKPVFPGDGNFSPLYPLGGDPPTGPAAPTNLSATAISSSQINLAWDHDLSGVDHFIIERDSQVVMDNWPANTQTYSDTGLNPSTEYSYRVAASGGGADTWSAPTSATTLTEGGDPTSVDVGSITLSTTGVGRGEKAGQATISVIDDLGNPVTNALISGEFTGDFTGTVTQADTGNSDSVAVRSESTVSNKTKNPAFTFCVTAIEHNTLANFTGQFCASQ
jgi:FtsP/CotA-like multicopper oxidase with cupredoxin domain